MSGFAPQWLRTREAFDLAARNIGLATRFAEALADIGTPLRIIDLAAGSGANFRALAPRLPGDQDWLLVDHDPLLLAAQREDIAIWAERQGWRVVAGDGGLLVDSGRALWRVRGYQLDLALQLEALDLSKIDGVVTTAFLDLVSAPWLARLCHLLQQHPRPLLATLSVDGRRRWSPPHPADAQMLAAFQAHQGGDKGFGPSLGNGACAHLATRLRDIGYQVSQAPSDWQIGPTQRAMLLQMLEEAVGVARESTPAAAHSMVDGWHRQRIEQLDHGSLSLEIGHQDLLALPAGL